MILSILGILIGTPLFFTGLYFASRVRGLYAWLWSILSIACLAAISAGIVTLAIPNFFTATPK